MKSERPKNTSSLPPHPPLRDYYAAPADRRLFVETLFDDAAEHYEWINRVMSLGSGARYRRDAMRRAGIGPGMTILDVCMGSGQVTRAAVELAGDQGRVLGMDASMGMLLAARDHVDVPLVRGLVEQLPFQDHLADAITMGYALRHVADLRTTFGEYFRVLKPGGRLLLIEFSKPRSRIGYLMLRAYLGSVVPAVALFKGRPAASMMRYFWDTIEACVPPETILDALREAGFVEPRKQGQLELFAEYMAVKPT